MSSRAAGRRRCRRYHRKVSVCVCERERKVYTRARSDEINAKIGLFHGDICRLELDGIVNAANSSLMGGGGIDGAIHRAAGDRLALECAWHFGARTGECKITRGYELPARYVLHTVGPIGENATKLRACYNNALACAVEHGVRTLAICGISTGIYGYPLENACHVALQTVRQWLEVPENRAKVDLIVFVTFLGSERETYTRLMAEYFPLQWPAAELAPPAPAAGDAATAPIAATADASPAALTEGGARGGAEAVKQ
jgi:O-acetyl-ADP-ribose deacetylase (regulator of RNase III)